MSKFIRAGIVFFFLFTATFAAEPKFIRLTTEDDKPASLDTAIATYVADEGGITIDLIGVVHVGEKEYYDKLQKQFEQYDVLLYELVAPPGTKPKQKRESTNIISLIQDTMKDALNLDHQMECVNYDKENFVHADLSFQQMKEELTKRGDDALTVGLGVFADMLRQANLQAQNPKPQPQMPEIDLAKLLLLGDQAEGLKLKRFFAVQLAGDSDNLGSTIEGILIVDRNKACMRVLQQQLVKGKKKIGIFYGAAHLPDFDKRLKTDLGMKQKKIEWLEAWNLRD